MSMPLVIIVVMMLVVEVVVGAAVVTVVLPLEGGTVLSVVEVLDVGACEGSTATTRLGSGTSVLTTEASDVPPPCPPRRSITSSGRHASVTTRAITSRRCVGCREVFRAAPFSRRQGPGRGRRPPSALRSPFTPPGAVPAT